MRMDVLQVDVAEFIAAMLQQFSHIHVLCYMEVWGTAIGSMATGPARPAPKALISW